MNKTININLGGSVFNIEEAAFLLLSNYLQRIKANFEGDKSADEIMADIEVRLAELFAQRLDERKNVILSRDVEEVIGIMGRPEDFADGEPAQEKKKEHTEYRNRNRRVYRDKDDAIVGGVCSGLSHYFGWDPLAVRLIVVALFLVSGGTAILGYIIFWSIVPTAETTAEKLQMRGEPATVENIRRFVNEEASQAAENFRHFSERAGKQAGSASYEFFHTAGKVIYKLAGVFMMFFGIALSLALVSMFAFSDYGSFGGANWTDFSHLMFNDDTTLWTLIFGIILLLGAPAISFMYTGFRILLGYKRKYKGVGIAFAILFSIGLGLAITGGIKLGSEFKSEAEIPATLSLDSLTTKTLFIEVPEDSIFKGRSRNRYEEDFMDMVRRTEAKTWYGNNVHLEFEAIDSGPYKIRIEKRSNGKSLAQASELADRIEYNYELRDSLLILPSCFSTPAGDNFRNQHIFIKVMVPSGYDVHFGEHIGKIYYRDSFSSSTHTMGKNEWKHDEEESEE